MTRSALVVGAGIGGLCTAIGLDRAGWQVRIVERWPHVVAAGAGLGVWPDAQVALDDLGVGDEFRAHAIDFGPVALYTAGGRRLVVLPTRRMEKKSGRPVRILSRSDLMDVLLAASAGIEIRTGVDVRDLGDFASVADLVIGADGLRSAVRETCFGSTSVARDTGLVGWRGAAAGETNGYGETWGEGSLFGVTRLAPGQTNWYAAVPTPNGHIESFDVLRQRFEHWRAPIPDVLANTDADVLRNPIHDLHPALPSFTRGNVALLGDAAHAMTPSLGRGACEAILDAAALVRALRDVRESSDLAGALARYDRERRRPTQRAAARSWRATRIATATSWTGARNTLVKTAAPFIH